MENGGEKRGRPLGRILDTFIQHLQKEQQPDNSDTDKHMHSCNQNTSLSEAKSHSETSPEVSNSEFT